MPDGGQVLILGQAVPSPAPASAAASEAADTVEW
jgi:hypothetical protein